MNEAKPKKARAKKQKLGDCYDASVREMLMLCYADPRNIERYLLIHAEVIGQGPLDGRPFGHAFLLDTETGEVVDKSNGQDRRWPACVYFAVGSIDRQANVFVYDFAEMKRKLMHHMHYGPWDLKTSSGD
jgi:hypothetical protein